VLICEENGFKELCFGWDWEGGWGRRYVGREEGGQWCVLGNLFVFGGRINWGLYIVVR
jgi:hypothetical protein